MFNNVCIGVLYGIVATLVVLSALGTLLLLCGAMMTFLEYMLYWTI